MGRKEGLCLQEEEEDVYEIKSPQCPSLNLSHSCPIRTADTLSHEHPIQLFEFFCNGPCNVFSIYSLERSDDSQLSGPGSGVPDR